VLFYTHVKRNGITARSDDAKLFLDTDVLAISDNSELGHDSHALANLLVIHLLQSLSLVSKLPNYTNYVTFSTSLLSTTRCCPI